MLHLRRTSRHDTPPCTHVPSLSTIRLNTHMALQHWPYAQPQGETSLSCNCSPYGISATRLCVPSCSCGHHVSSCPLNGRLRMLACRCPIAAATRAVGVVALWWGAVGVARGGCSVCCARRMLCWRLAVAVGLRRLLRICERRLRMGTPTVRGTSSRVSAQSGCDGADGQVLQQGGACRRAMHDIVWWGKAEATGQGCVTRRWACCVRLGKIFRLQKEIGGEQQGVQELTRTWGAGGPAASFSMLLGCPI